MSAGLAVSIVIGLIVLGLTIVVYALRKKGKRQGGYRRLFALGVVWLSIGVMNLLFGRSFVISVPFITMGLIYLVVGLANRGKWKESQPLTANQKKLTVGLMAAGIIVFLLVLAIYLLRVFR